MSLLWKEAFTLGDFSWSNTNSFSDIIEITDLEALKHFLDAVHVKFCLLKPWCETENYPLVDSRDLLPSFEAELWEYKGLPGFSMVAFARPLESFSEIFQYDILHPVLSAVNTAEGASCPLETHVIARNVQMFLSRLPKKLQDPFRDQFRRVDTAVLDYYPALMPYLLAMDRAHVFATDIYGHYHLAGLFASFPSDMDGEIKRFGLRTGKFKIGDNEMYDCLPVFNGTVWFSHFLGTPDLGGAFFPASAQARRAVPGARARAVRPDDHNHLEQWREPALPAC